MKVSLDNGETWQDAPNGVRVIQEGVYVPVEGKHGEVHLNCTDEGVIVDVWVSKKSPLDHNAGTKAEMWDELANNVEKA